MQFKAVLFALFAAAASAQDLSQVPSCARPCLNENVGDSGCKKTDYKCLCQSEEFMADVAGCTLNKCDKSDALKARDWAMATCKEAGVEL